MSQFDHAIPCSVCGFDLRGIAIGGACPECGTPIGRAVGPTLPSGGATTSLVCGILSIVSIMFCGFVGLPLGIVAMMSSSKAKRLIQTGQADPSGLGSAKAGSICGLIGVIINSIWVAFMLGYFVLVGFAISSFP